MNMQAKQVRIAQLSAKRNRYLIGILKQAIIDEYWTRLLEHESTGDLLLALYLETNRAIICRKAEYHYEQAKQYCDTCWTIYHMQDREFIETYGLIANRIYEHTKIAA